MSTDLAAQWRATQIPASPSQNGSCQQRPINYEAFTSKPRPLSASDSDLIDAKKFKELFEQKRAVAKAGLCLQPAVSLRGTLDTSSGIFLNKGAAFKLAEEMFKQREAAEAAEAKRKAERELNERLVCEKKRRARIAHETAALARRVAVYNVPNKPVRTMAVRRAAAVKMVKERRALAVASDAQ